MEKINFAFLGTPDIAYETLDILKSSGYEPTIIITSPDQKSGRGMEIKETPVARWARDHNILCLKPEKIDTSFINDFKKLEMDLSIVVAYGKILPESFIYTPKFGTINTHYSLLPRYRGASPLQQALLNGDNVTGVSIQQMIFKLDSGAIIISKGLLIDINDTKAELKAKLIKLGGDLLVKVIPKIIHKKIIFKAQNEAFASHCKKIKKEDGEIDPNGNPEENYNKYRAYFGWPGVYFFTDVKGKKIRVKITKARYENNSFIIERVISEGKKEIDYTEFLKNIN